MTPMDSATQKNIVIRIRDGDAQAEGELVERFARPLKLILLKRTGDPQLSNDLVQDTFVIAIQKLRGGEVRKPEALAAFLRQTAINLSIEHYRKEKRYVAQEDGIIALHAPHKDRKAEGMDRMRARKMLETLLEQLSTVRDREILHRFYLLDEDKPLICSALGLSAAHFDRVLYRARQRMRDLLMEQPELKVMLFGSLFDG